MRTPVFRPGPTITGSHLRYRREASIRAGLSVGTTLEITTPSTTARSRPRNSNSWRNSRPISSAVRSRWEVTRQSATRLSPSNRASVTLVLPTSTASSILAGTLRWWVGWVCLAPAQQPGRLAAHRRGPGRHPSRVGRPGKVTLAHRGGGLRGRFELPVAHLPPDRFVGLTERHPGAHEI